MDKRDDFQGMLKDCRKGKIDRIIAKSISRFARNWTIVKKVDSKKDIKSIKKPFRLIWRQPIIMRMGSEEIIEA